MTSQNDLLKNDVIELVNKRIRNDICLDTIENLKDNNLLEEYKKCISVKANIDYLSEVLKNNNVKNKDMVNIVNDYLLKLIPPSTKAVIRGLKFNEIVRNYIMNLNLDKNRFDVKFEEHCNKYKTSEKPDWFILEKKTNKVIIGMNQLDLVNGGQQLNRGYKYIVENDKNTEDKKLLCVICNNAVFKTNKSKAFNLFKIGFDENTLCYLNGMLKIIKIHFNL